VPQTATIYAKDTPKQIIAGYKMRADVNGDVEIPNAFRNPQEMRTLGDVVPPILACADLTATTDGRNLEAAKMIYDQYVEPALAVLIPADRLLPNRLWRNFGPN
jgi:hypothetical protein